MQRSVIAIIAAFAVGGFACARAPQAFQPAERATALSPQGYSAAEYELVTPRADFGEARVWSEGARLGTYRGEERTLVHVAFDIENETGEPLELPLEDLQLDSATLNEEVIRGVEVASIEGQPVIPPYETGTVNAWFALPKGVKPQHVDAFRVKWRLKKNGLTYVQNTPFVEYEEYYYYTPFYDPFYYDPYVYHPGIIVYDRAYRHYHGGYPF